MSERFANILSRRTPQLVHAMGPKPWNRSAVPPSTRKLGGGFGQRMNAYYNYLMLETSPYLVTANKLERSDLSGSAWLRRFSLGGRLLAAIGFNNINLTGLPLAFIDSGGKFVKRVLKLSRFTTDQRYFLEYDPLERPLEPAGLEPSSSLR